MPGRMQGNVALRHHVRPQECHQQINIRSPFADAFQTDLVASLTSASDSDSGPSRSIRFSCIASARCRAYAVFCRLKPSAFNSASDEAKSDSGDNRPTLRHSLSKHARAEASETCCSRMICSSVANRAPAPKAAAGRISITQLENTALSSPAFSRLAADSVRRSGAFRVISWFQLTGFQELTTKPHEKTRKRSSFLFVSLRVGQELVVNDGIIFIKRCHQIEDAVDSSNSRVSPFGRI